MNIKGFCCSECHTQIEKIDEDWAKCPKCGAKFDLHRIRHVSGQYDK